MGERDEDLGGAPADDAAEAATEKSFGQPERLRRPSKDEIAQAVEATPTVEDQRAPELEVPAYLKKDQATNRVSGTVGKGAPEPAEAPSAPGFTDTPSDDPTEKASALSAPVIPRQEATPRGGPPMLVFVAVALAGLAVVLFALLRS